MKLTDEKILELAVASKLARLNGTQHVVAHWPDTIIGLELVTFARAILKEAGVEEMAEKAELHDAIQEAAGALVGGYSIELKVERHAGWVDMFDADGCLQDFPSNHESLADSVRDALAEAIRCTEQDK